MSIYRCPRDVAIPSTARQREWFYRSAVFEMIEANVPAVTTEVSDDTTGDDLIEDVVGELLVLSPPLQGDDAYSYAARLLCLQAAWHKDPKRFKAAEFAYWRRRETEALS